MRVIMRWWNVPGDGEPKRHIYLRAGEPSTWELTATQGDAGAPWKRTTEDEARAYAAEMMRRAGGHWQPLR